MKTEYKQTPIGKIPVEWKIVKLGRVVETTKGKKPSVLLEEKSESRLPYLTAEYMRKNSNVQWCESDDPDMVKVDKSDTIMIWDGSYSGDVFTGFEGALASTMAKLKTEENLDGKFLYYFLKTKFHFLNGTTSGTGVPHISKSIFRNLHVPLPPLVEQRGIAEILSCVDEAIRSVDEAIVKTERLKKDLMRRLLTEGTGHKEFKETKIGKIPKVWQVTRLGDIAKLKSGGTPSRKKPEYWNGKIPWVKSGELNDAEIYDTEEKITELGLKESSAEIFPKGALLIALYGKGTVSKTAILGIDAATNQAVAAIFPRKNSFGPVYMKNCLIFFRRKMLNQLVNPSSDVGRTNIYLRMLKLFQVPIPPLLEQQKIAKILSTMDHKLGLDRKRQVKLERIKKGFMANLLTGKKRIRVC